MEEKPRISTTKQCSGSTTYQSGLAGAQGQERLFGGGGGSRGISSVKELTEEFIFRLMEWSWVTLITEFPPCNSLLPREINC